MPFRKGSKVSWTWGAHEAQGKIVERFTSRVTRTIKGTEVTREASHNEPAYRTMATGCLKAGAN